MKLTKAQVEALRLLAADDRQTSRQTTLGCVSGQTMAALVRKKLAFPLPQSSAGERFYRMNVDGRMALEELARKAAMEKVATSIEHDMFATDPIEHATFRGLSATIKETP